MWYEGVMTGGRGGSAQGGQGEDGWARVAGERDDRWPRAAKEDRGSAERSGKLAQVAQVHTQPEDAGDQPLSYRGAVTTAWPGSAGGTEGC